MSFKLQPAIWSRDTGHISIHEGTYGDQNQIFSRAPRALQSVRSSAVMFLFDLPGLINNYSMSARWIGDTTSLISNKREWNNCFSKFSLNSERLDTWKLKQTSFQLGNTWGNQFPY